MGEKLRLWLREMQSAAKRATCPAFLLSLLFALWNLFSGQTDMDSRDYSVLWLYVLLYALVICTVIEYRLDLDRKRYAFGRVDERLLGSLFGGWSKKDRLFCRSLNCLSMEHHPSKALQGFLAVLEQDLTDAERAACCFYTGQCYAACGCWLNATQYYRTAGDLGFHPPVQQLLLSRALTAMGEYDEAASVLLTLEQLPDNQKDPELCCVCTDLGFVYLKKKDGASACTWFRTAMERGENYSTALGGMAAACCLTGEAEKSQNFYQRALLNGIPDPESFKQYYASIAEEFLPRQEEDTSHV